MGKNIQFGVKHSLKLLNVSGHYSAVSLATRIRWLTTDLLIHGRDRAGTCMCVSSLPEVTISSPVTGTQSESPLSQPQSLAKCKAHIGYIPQLFVWGRGSIWDQHWAGSICHPETSTGDLVTVRIKSSLVDFWCTHRFGNQGPRI